ncbi:MAG: HAD hydrolase-like protein [Pseudomonadota bacterium]
MTNLVIFDCDGVLINSEGIACAADAQALTANGYPITTEQMAARFAGVPTRPYMQRSRRRRVAPCRPI